MPVFISVFRAHAALSMPGGKTEYGGLLSASRFQWRTLGGTRNSYGSKEGSPKNFSNMHCGIYVDDET